MLFNLLYLFGMNYTVGNRIKLTDYMKDEYILNKHLKKKIYTGVPKGAEGTVLKICKKDKMFILDIEWDHGYSLKVLFPFDSISIIV